MISVRCKMAVEAVLKDAGIRYHSVVLGKAVLESALNSSEKAMLGKGLQYYELELMEDKTKILVEQIKIEINSLLNSGEGLEFKLSAHLSKLLEYNYTYIANMFSEQEGITLEHYFIAQRVEKAKELIVYENLSSSHIAMRLDYSSVSHFSAQFKKVTGLTPAEYKKLSNSDDFEWKPLL